MDNRDDNKKIKSVGKMLWRIIFPFGAIRDTVTLAKKELRVTKQNLEAIKELGIEAKSKLADTLKNKKTIRNDSFEEAMRRRSRNALSEKELYEAFLRDKRVALGIGLIFAVFGMYALLHGVTSESGREILLSVMSLMASQPLFFLVALRAQLRLWQLKTRRLSIEEKGGLEDFMREVPDWVWVTLDPELGSERGADK